jgi:methionine-rich copper-binding protein CopC
VYYNGLRQRNVTRVLGILLLFTFLLLPFTDNAIAQEVRNRDPVISNVRVNPPKVRDSGSYEVSWHVEDPDGDDLKVKIQFPDNNDFTEFNVTRKGDLVDASFFRPRHTGNKVVITAADDYGGKAVHELTIEEVRNHNPVISNVRVNPPKVRDSGSYEVSWHVEDPDGDDLKVRIQFPDKNDFTEFNVTRKGDLVDASFFRPRHTGIKVVITATDDYGGKAVHELTIEEAGVFLPDFTGKPLAEAKKWLEQNGFKINLQPGSLAPAPALSGTVEKQDPAAKAEMTKGNTVMLTIHSAYVDLRSVPDIHGLAQDAAGSKLEQAGLVMDRRDAGRPAESRLANTVQKQDPAPGTSITKGSAVAVWVYGQYTSSREERVAATDCSHYPESRAYWDETAGGPRCGCFDGLVWNLATSHCVPADIRANEVCAREMPGTSAQGQTPEGKINCVCPDGQFWNTSQRRCERQLAEPPVQRSCTFNTSMMGGDEIWCDAYMECQDAECLVTTMHVVNIAHIKGGFKAPGHWLYSGYNSCEGTLRHYRVAAGCR